MCSTKKQPIDWAVAIFAARELPETLCSSINTTLQACRERHVSLDVLINGNTDLSSTVSDAFKLGSIPIPTSVDLRIWSFQVADKANTWNQYIHNLWPKGRISFFIDGYASIEINSLKRIEKFLNSHEDVLCASGSPSNGRSSKKFQQTTSHGGGGIHGNLYGLPNNTIAELRRIQLNLPKGLYRTDSLLGAVLAYSFSPKTHSWTLSNLAILPDVGWTVPEKYIWNPIDVFEQLRRIARQARGNIENMALRQFLSLDKSSPSDLPSTITELIDDWLTNHPDQAKELLRYNPIRKKALNDLLKNRDWSTADTMPDLVYSSGQYSR